MPTIFDLPNIVEKLSAKEKKQFLSIFSYYQSSIPLSYPSEEIQHYVSKRFGLSELTNREVIAVSNWVLGQETIFNPVRANKPTSRPFYSSSDPTKAGKSRSQFLTSSNSKVIDCDFCDIINKTSHDPFGRLESKYALTAANAGSYDGLHGLIIPKDIHNVFHITESIFTDMLELAMQWIRQANTSYPQAVFPVIFWNSSLRAGASLIHPHFQIILRTQPLLKLRMLYETMAIYKERNNHSFFPTFFATLDTLGLTQQCETTTIATNLTPIKEKEMILWEKNNKLSTENLWKIVAWWKKSDALNFNMIITLPPLDKRWKNFLTFSRFVNRGHGTTNDIASMELFYAAIVSSDPFKVIGEFKKNQ